MHFSLLSTIFCFLTIVGSSLTSEAASEVRYEDFGAVGDGKTDDFDALIKAHDHANAKGLPVKAKDHATYFISSAKKTISIMTDTDFGSASFVIDDTKIENGGANVFEVRSKQKQFNVKDIKSMTKGQTRINTQVSSACLILITNNNVKRFIRFGANQNSGKAQTDVFLVDKSGLIDPKTPVIWDFAEISKMIAYPVDEKKLTIKGGKFTTIACSIKSSVYCARGIGVFRSNVIVDGIKHLIQGEGETGRPYSGFISISECANVIIRDTVFSGRKIYYKVGNSGSMTPMGSYGLSINSSVNVALLRCTQINDIMDRTIWGVMATNFCKNIILDGCKLSRFDAHMGVTNATIRNSILGYMGIKLTGFGTFLVENTTVRSTDFISLRPDYGSTWNGEIMIRNCRFEPTKISNGLSIISGSNHGQHDFGYTTYLPSKVVIDELLIADSASNKDYKGPAIFGNFSPKMIDASYKPPHPQSMSKLVTYSDLEIESGKSLRISDNNYMFRDVKVQKVK